MNDIPLPVLFLATMILIIASIEVGSYMGRVLQFHKKGEKNEVVEVIAGSVLGLLSFILAFTFGIAFARFDARKELVRDEANQISTVWLRTDFIPEPDRTTSRKLLKEYLDLRIEVVKSGDVNNIDKTLAHTDIIQQQLWSLSKRHAEKAMHSDLGALYYDALNQLIVLQQLRVAIAYRGQLPTGLTISLYVLLVLAMLSIGYYAAMVESKRNFAAIVLAFSFSLVISIIVNVNQLQTNHFKISQQPLTDLQTRIAHQD